ncbi:Uncharacterised protein [Shigella sonnei]|nr:Uncharacterised protein [Shigella sonnei]
MDIEIVSFQRRQCTSNKQQRITRQEWRYHQPRFAEQNQKQNGINPDAVLRDQLCQMHVNVQDKIDEEINQVHICLCLVLVIFQAVTTLATA